MRIFKSPIWFFLFLIQCAEVPIAPELESRIQNKKVLIFGIDGLRSDALTEEYAPHLHNLLLHRHTIYSLNNLTEISTISGPNWGSICTGVHMDKHKIKDNLFQGNNVQKYPHFMRYIESFDDRIQTASYAHWFPINLFMALGSADYAPVTFNIADEKVASEAVKLVSRARPIDPDVLFLHFDDCDNAGHASGFTLMSPEYVSAIKKTDDHFNQVFNAIKQRSTYPAEDWLICIVSDHGGDEFGSHENYSDTNVRNTIMIFNNDKRIPENTKLETVEQVDLVPSIFDFLEIPIEENWELDGNSLIK